MRKVLFISNQYSPNIVGGAEITVQTLAEELARRGYEITVISLSSTGEDSVDRVNGIRVHRVAVRNLYSPFQQQHHPVARALWHVRDVYNRAMAAEVEKILDEERPDWVSAHNLGGFSVAVWAAVKARGIGLSQMLHDYYAICPRTTMNKGGKNCQVPCTVCRAYGLPKKVASRLPDVVIGVSRFVLERHLVHGYFPRARSGVVYNGRPFHGAQHRLPRAPDAPLTLGFIGRIEPLKGIETLLKAVSRLPLGRWRLRVAGRAPDPAYLSELQRRYPLPQVEYLGYVKSEQLYESVDLVVVPSEWYEPMAGVVYEPLGFGLPVLAANVGGIPEILDGAGCGWLFPPGDVDGLEAKLRELLDGWPDPDGMRARALARRAFFTPGRQADEFLALTAGNTAP
jgi:glycosyltransferase involved in cell wall biosynthesis